MIYGRLSCPFCVRACDFCEQLGVEFVYVDMANDPATQEDVFSRSQGMKTVPQIFVGEKHIGGFTDMVALHERGDLLPLCTLKQ